MHELPPPQRGRRSGEIIAASWATLDYLHTLFRDRAAGSLDFFTRTSSTSAETAKLWRSGLTQRQGCRGRGAMCIHCTRRALGVQIFRCATRQPHEATLHRHHTPQYNSHTSWEYINSLQIMAKWTRKELVALRVERIVRSLFIQLAQYFFCAQYTRRIRAPPKNHRHHASPSQLTSNTTTTQPHIPLTNTTQRTRDSTTHLPRPSNTDTHEAWATVVLEVVHTFVVPIVVFEVPKVVSANVFKR